MGEKEPNKDTNHKAETILGQEFVRPILDKAKEYIKTYGQLDPTPLYLRFENGELSVVPLEFPETAEERKEYFSALGLSMRLIGRKIHEALLVLDVWFVTPEEEDTIDMAPSQHPNRKEAIAIMGRDAQGARSTHVLQPYKRDAQNLPVFESPIVEEYNVPTEAGYQAEGLIDYLFD